MPGEKYAFVSAYKKHGLAVLAAALAPEHTIITMGGTKTEIERFGIEDVSIVLPEEFLASAALTGYLAAAKDERERRELVATPISHRMARSAEEVDEPLIDFVYVHLMPNMRRPDKGGVFMISAAAEGRRLLYTQPHELEEAANWLAQPHTPDQETVYREELAQRALQAIGRHYFYG